MRPSREITRQRRPRSLTQLLPRFLHLQREIECSLVMDSALFVRVAQAFFDQAQVEAGSLSFGHCIEGLGHTVEHIRQTPLRQVANKKGRREHCPRRPDFYSQPADLSAGGLNRQPRRA
jgi:hypothetical protein